MTSPDAADEKRAAALVTMAEALLAKDLPHPPLTLLFTVGEERGLAGSRHVELATLKPRGRGRGPARTTIRCGTLRARHLPLAFDLPRRRSDSWRAATLPSRCGGGSPADAEPGR